MPTPFGPALQLSVDEQQRLTMLSRASSTPQALAFRCRVILRVAASDQPANYEVAEELGCNRRTVGVWRRRYAAQGLAGLQDAVRSGRPRTFPPSRSRRSPHN